MASMIKDKCALFLIVTVSLDLTRAAPQLNVSPLQIDLGLTDALNINCSFTLGSAPNMAGFISLVISRGKDSEQTFEDLATLSQFDGQKVTHLTSETVSAEGIIYMNGKSWLSLHWEYPDVSQGGVYTCSAHGFDPSGRVTVFTSDSVQVRANQPNINDYKARMIDMGIGLENVQNKLSDLENKLNMCEQNLKSRVGALEKQQLLEKFEDPFTYQDRQYFVSKEPYSNINESISTCKLYGGWLTEINDVAEHQALQASLRSITGYTDVVVAGTDAVSEGTWVLPSSGQVVTYVDWSTGQPNGGLNENCLVLCYPPAWKMCDLPCGYSSPSVNIRYICEIPMKS